MPSRFPGAAFSSRDTESSHVKLTAILVVVMLVAACGSTTPTPPPSVGSSAAPSIAAHSPGASAVPSSTPFAGTPATVRLALDWTPNTDHTGFYVARQRAGIATPAIELQVLPYATATPETLLAAHQAECGISFQDSMTFAVAAGADIVSVAAILQKTASAIGVLAERPDPATPGPRRQDVRRVRLPERGADAEGRHRGRRRQGHLQGGDARCRGVRGALQPQGRLHDPVHGVGRGRG